MTLSELKEDLRNQFSSIKKNKNEYILGWKVRRIDEDYFNCINGNRIKISGSIEQIIEHLIESRRREFQKIRG